MQIQGQDATNWVCNSAGCNVQLNSVDDAERHVASSIDTPDIETLLKMQTVQDQKR